MEYCIENEKLRVRVSTKGAELQSIRGADGTEYLWQGDARFCAVCGQPFASEEAKSEDAPKPEVEINWPEASAEEPSAEEPAQSDEEQP